MAGIKKVKSKLKGRTSYAQSQAGVSGTTRKNEVTAVPGTPQHIQDLSTKMQGEVANLPTIKRTSSNVIEPFIPQGGLAPATTSVSTAATPSPDQSFLSKIFNLPQTIKDKIAGISPEAEYLAKGIPKENPIAQVANTFDPTQLVSKAITNPGERAVEIGTATAGLGVESAIGKLAIGSKYVRGSVNTASAAREAESIKRIASYSGKSIEEVEKAVSNAKLTKGVNGLLKEDAITKAAKKLLKYAGAIAGADVLVSWYAMDNVISGQRFYIQDLAKKVSDGIIEPEKAMEAVEQSNKTRELAKGFLTKSTSYNPLLIPFKRIIMSGADIDETSIQQNAEIIGLYNSQQLKDAADAVRKGTATQEEQDLAEKYNPNLYFERIEREKQEYQATQNQLISDRIQASIDREEENRIYWEQRREEDKAYYEAVEERRRLAKEAERKAEEEYWAQVAKRLEEQQKKRLEEEKAYWDEVNKKRDESLPSHLNFGIL